MLTEMPVIPEAVPSLSFLIARMTYLSEGGFDSIFDIRRDQDRFDFVEYCKIWGNIISIEQLLVMFSCDVCVLFVGVCVLAISSVELLGYIFLKLLEKSSAISLHTFHDCVGCLRRISSYIVAISLFAILFWLVCLRFSGNALHSESAFIVVARSLD
jgi:hypothetical protein